MVRFLRSTIGGLRTARWYLLALIVVLAISAGVPTMTVAAAPAQAAGDGFPVPALIGAMVLAFAVGLTAAQVRRRRRSDAPPPTEAAATPEPPPPEPAAPPRPAPPSPKPARPRRSRVVRLEPPRAAPPPPPPAPDEAAWIPPEPVDPAARSAREPAGEPDPALLQAPEAPLPSEAAPAVVPEVPLDEAPESPVARPRAPARPVPRDEPWPDDAEAHWTCEIAWKAGYVKSTFRAMAGAPGSARRRPVAESPPLRWTLMTDPDPPTPEMVAGVRSLVDALVADGWERIGSAGPWYAQRFLWRRSGEPGNVAVQAPPDAGEASSG